MKLFPNAPKQDPLKKIMAMETILNGHIFWVVLSSFPTLKEEKKDIAQEVMIRLIACLGKLELMAPQELVNYTIGIARHVCCDMVKSRKKMPEVNMESLPDNPDDKDERQTFTSENEKLMTQAIEELSPECIQVLKLYYFEKGFSKDRLIAEKLNQKTDTVKQRRHRCEKSLVDIIKGNKKYQELVICIPPSKRK